MSTIDPITTRRVGARLAEAGHTVCLLEAGGSDRSPFVQVPAGFISGVGGKETPEYPLGITFTGRAWSEARLLRLAYAYEQASNARRPPPGLPVL